VPQILFCRCLIKGEKKPNQTKPTKCPNFKCNTVSVSFSACRCSSVVFSSKVGREKKKSLETVLWMAICGCGLPARCCQPAVAGGVIYADLRSELKTQLASQALFTQSSPEYDHHCCKLSPFQAHWGRWHCTNFLRPVCLFTVHVGSGLLPSPVEFSSLCHFYKLSHSWLLGMCCCSCLLPPGLFIYSSLRDPPPPPLVLRAPHPLCYVSFLLLLLLIIQFLFFPGWGSVCPGGYADLVQGCLWEYRVPLSSPCGLCLPKLSGCWRLVIIF
jgi:hypothetical protein